MPCVNRSGCESRRKSSEKVFCDGGQESRRELSLLVSLLTTLVEDSACDPGDVLRSVNGTASKCKTFLATATEECCPARGTLAGHFTRRLSPSPMPGKRIQQQRAYLPLKRSSPRPQFYRRARRRRIARKAFLKKENQKGWRTLSRPCARQTSSAKSGGKRRAPRAGKEAPRRRD